jgi:CheY-like chemotaxis protein
VLVVEDNDFNRILLQDTLICWGYQVTSVEDGLKALQMLNMHKYDLILLDIRMPGVDGLDVARLFRAQEQRHLNSPLPIIAITADADAATREACFAAGINDVLAKPVSLERLAMAVSSHCVTPASDQGLLLNQRTRQDLGNSAAKISEYYDLLLKDISEEMKNLTVSCHNNKRLEIKRTAHTLKGLCGHLSQQELAVLVLWVERHAETAPEEQLVQVIEQVGEAWRNHVGGGVL